MNGDVKSGFWIGLGLLGALLVWHLVTRLGLGALNASTTV